MSDRTERRRAQKEAKKGVKLARCNSSNRKPGSIWDVMSEAWGKAAVLLDAGRACMIARKNDGERGPHNDDLAEKIRGAVMDGRVQRHVGHDGKTCYYGRISDNAVALATRADEICFFVLYDDSSTSLISLEDDLANELVGLIDKRGPSPGGFIFL